MMTARELQEAILRAHNECRQEIGAATLEYKDAVRPIAARRKQRGVNARSKRDRKIADLRKQFTEEEPERLAERRAREEARRA